MGVIPDFQTVRDPRAAFVPLTRKQKWSLAFKETVDPFNIASAGLLANVLHQDPRYYRKGPGSGVLQRVVYSVSRIVIARQDTGAAAFNASGVFGTVMGIAASNLYYPADSRRAAVPKSDIRNTETADYKTHFKMPDYTSRKQWEERRLSLRQQILSAAGLLPMPLRTPLHPRIVRRLTYQDYSIEVVLIETLPGHYLGGNLYRPMGKTVPAPAVLLPHGHWKRGRLEDKPSYGGWREDLWSFHPMGLQLWNSIRALDFLQSLPDVDPHRIAATGASGGGTQTFLLAAVDERVRYVAPVNMVSAHMQGGDPCEEAPNLRLDTFNVEMAAMIAPRPMLLVSSTHDWTRHTPLEEFPAIRRIYALYGVPDRVRNAHIDAEHNYNRQSRESVYRFLAKTMQGGRPPSALVDGAFSLPAEQDLLAYPKLGARDLEGYADVFQMWKITATLQTQSSADPAAQREALRYALAVDWPSRPEAVIDVSRMVLSRIGKGDRVTGYWRPGKGTPVLIVHPGGSSAALRTEAVEKLMPSGRPVLILEPFISHAARILKQRFDEYFLSYNQTDAADRVQDILTALAFLKARSGGRPELIGLGDGGIWCVFAAAVAPIAIDVIANLNGFGGSDEDFRDRFFVPGIQRAGGLSAALKLVSTARGIIPAPVSARVITGVAGQ